MVSASLPEVSTTQRRYGRPKADRNSSPSRDIPMASTPSPSLPMESASLPQAPTVLPESGPHRRAPEGRRIDEYRKGGSYSLDSTKSRDPYGGFRLLRLRQCGG